MQAGPYSGKSEMANPNGPNSIAPLDPFFVGLGGALLMAALFTDYVHSSNSLL
jgi:hypothetical protein